MFRNNSPKGAPVSFKEVDSQEVFFKTYKFQKLLALSFAAILSLSACGTETENFNEISPAVQINDIGRGPAVFAPVIQAFLNNVSRFNISLNDGQLREISMQRHIRPSGLWASRPAMNLTGDQNLNVHFIKHRMEFKGINSPEQYLQRSLDFQLRQSPSITYYFDTTSFDKDYQSNVVKYDARTREFGAVRSNGDITTYYTSDPPSAKRFIIVPEEFTF
jgi:hypothetical protein